MGISHGAGVWGLLLSYDNPEEALPRVLVSLPLLKSILYHEM
jgi:hypothetical protein